MNFLRDLAQHEACSGRQVDLDKVSATVPFHGCGEEFASGMINTTMTTEALLVRIQCDAIGTWDIDTNAIVCVGLRGVEVENEQCAGAFKGYDTV